MRSLLIRIKNEYTTSIYPRRATYPSDTQPYPDMSKRKSMEQTKEVLSELQDEYDDLIIIRGEYDEGCEACMNSDEFCDTCQADVRLLEKEMRKLNRRIEAIVLRCRNIKRLYACR